MKRISMIISAVFLFGTMLTGCAGNRDMIAKASVSARQDVFQEAKAAQPAASKALLKVEFSVKNFKARFVENYIKHTDPPYTALLNIDGQTVVLSDEPVLEDLPGDFKVNPEVGTGWKYNFKKTLELQPGKHRVSIAVPLSNVIVEKEIDLKEGENTLKITPAYMASVIRYRDSPRFSHGLRGVTAKLNNIEI